VKAVKKREKREKSKADPPLIIITMVVHRIKEEVGIRDSIKLEEEVISSKEEAEVVIMLLLFLNTLQVFP
jgi:hypothetical protein